MPQPHKVPPVQINSQIRLQRTTSKRQQLLKMKQRQAQTLKQPRASRPVLKSLRVRRRMLGLLKRLPTLLPLCLPSRRARWWQCAAMTARA